VPDVAAQAESCTTLVPSRFKTVSRVLHALFFGQLLLFILKGHVHGREFKTYPL